MEVGKYTRKAAMLQTVTMQIITKKYNTVWWSVRKLCMGIVKTFTIFKTFENISLKSRNTGAFTGQTTVESDLLFLISVRQ